MARKKPTSNSKSMYEVPKTSSEVQITSSNQQTNLLSAIMPENPSNIGHSFETIAEDFKKSAEAKKYLEENNLTYNLVTETIMPKNASVTDQDDDTKVSATMKSPTININDPLQSNVLPDESKMSSGFKRTVMSDSSTQKQGQNKKKKDSTVGKNNLLFPELQTNVSPKKAAFAILSSPHGKTKIETPTKSMAYTSHTPIEDFASPDRAKSALFQESFPSPSQKTPTRKFIDKM